MLSWQCSAALASAFSATLRFITPLLNDAGLSTPPVPAHQFAARGRSTSWSGCRCHLRQGLKALAGLWGNAERPGLLPGLGPATKLFRALPGWQAFRRF